MRYILCIFWFWCDTSTVKIAYSALSVAYVRPFPWQPWVFTPIWALNCSIHDLLLSSEVHATSPRGPSAGVVFPARSAASDKREPGGRRRAPATGIAVASTCASDKGLAFTSPLGPRIVSPPVQLTGLRSEFIRASRATPVQSPADRAPGSSWQWQVLCWRFFFSSIALHFVTLRDTYQQIAW